MALFQLPTREKTAAKSGPRLEYAPSQIAEIVRHPSGHGLSGAISADKSWEPFAWKGTDYAAWLRTLFVAELHGLLTFRPDNTSSPVAVSDIANSINEYLAQFGKHPITESTVLNQLRQAKSNVSIALGVRLDVDSSAMTVRVMDGNESVAAVTETYDRMKTKAAYISDVLESAQRLDFDMSGVLTDSPEFVRLAGNVTKILTPAG